ncbi:hypothetical protein [Streptomyces nanshensis]|uniref:hypothetical protein n=1 Tax=Streptomyces nanshensis TaxID=518642 RepID=UPI00085C2FC4|nr:hypothetical protein [Streptomyces nanshensis]
MLTTSELGRRLATFARDDAQFGVRGRGEVLPGITLAPASEPGALEITDRYRRAWTLARWATEEAHLAVLHRDEESLTVTDADHAPRYVAAFREADCHHVYDRVNGYALIHDAYSDRGEAWEAAQELNASPLAAAQAVTAHDNALVASSPAGAALLDIRRYGHRGALRSAVAESLQRTDVLAAWRWDQHLWMVWSGPLGADAAGEPYYLTLERRRSLPVEWIRAEGALWPTVPVGMLRRPVVDEESALPCAWHRRPFCTRSSCNPGVVWECVWDACGANAVTVVEGRPACNRCAPAAIHRTVASDGGGGVEAS